MASLASLFLVRGSTFSILRSTTDFCHGALQQNVHTRAINAGYHACLTRVVDQPSPYTPPYRLSGFVCAKVRIKGGICTKGSRQEKGQRKKGFVLVGKSPTSTQKRRSVRSHLSPPSMRRRYPKWGRLHRGTPPDDPPPPSSWAKSLQTPTLGPMRKGVEPPSTRRIVRTPEGMGGGNSWK